MKYKILSLALALSCATATFASADDYTSSSASSRPASTLTTTTPLIESGIFTKIIDGKIVFTTEEFIGIGAVHIEGDRVSNLLDSTFKEFNMAAPIIISLAIEEYEDRAPSRLYSLCEDMLSIVYVPTKEIVNIPAFTDRALASANGVQYYMDIKKNQRTLIKDTKTETTVACIRSNAYTGRYIVVGPYVYNLDKTSSMLSVTPISANTKVVNDLPVGKNARSIHYVAGKVAIVCADGLYLTDLDQLNSQLHIATTAVAPSSASSASTTPPAAE